jgi:ABC-type branched-subunit amino acid transport system substrate-binding protein
VTLATEVATDHVGLSWPITFSTLWSSYMSRRPTMRATARERVRQRTFRALGTPLALGAVAALALSACGRSDTLPTPVTTGAATAGAPSAATTSAAAAGDFGTLKGICGPGDAKGATAKGVTDTQITIGVTADPGAAAAPGLEQEFFDTADGFSKWCNAAGGINGRKIVVKKHDAKLFDVGQAMTQACQTDFMLVGNGNAFDSAGIKVREGCKLGQIPAYVVAPEALTAKYQVLPTPIPNNEINNGALRLLTAAYPDVKAAGVGIGSSTIASIRPTGLKAQEYLKDLGIKVAVLSEHPALVDNFRPYMEQLKAAGAKGYYEISAQDPGPEVQAMKNVGWTPDYVLYGTQFYGPQAVQSAKGQTFPPSYVQFGALPFELKDKYPVLQQTEDIVKSAVKNPKLTTFTLSSFSAWLLFAQSATACGSNLTMDCVLQKAADHDDWDAGGLYPAHSVKAGAHASPCVAIVELTPNGFVYNEKITDPTSGDGPFNCDPENVKTVKTYIQ